MRSVAGASLPVEQASTTEPEASVQGDSHDCITAEDVANGMDMQGFRWPALPFAREDYRAMRLRECCRDGGRNPQELLNVIEPQARPPVL